MSDDERRELGTGRSSMRPCTHLVAQAYIHTTVVYIYSQAMLYVTCYLSCMCVYQHRSGMSDDELRGRLKPFIEDEAGDKSKIDDFLQHVYYRSGERYIE
jgi:hypothetical protein